MCISHALRQRLLVRRAERRAEILERILQPRHLCTERLQFHLELRARRVAAAERAGHARVGVARDRDRPFRRRDFFGRRSRSSAWPRPFSPAT